MSNSLGSEYTIILTLRIAALSTLIIRLSAQCQFQGKYRVLICKNCHGNMLYLRNPFYIKRKSILSCCHRDGNIAKIKTYEEIKENGNYLGTRSSLLCSTVGSTSNMEARSFPLSTEIRVYTGLAPRNLFLFASFTSLSSSCF